MRIASGVTDQYIYFVALDAEDMTARKTGLTSFTVYRSRNGGSATAFTTPTIAELSSSNMPGIYSLLLDEDMTIDTGDVEQEYCVHITADDMVPVTRVFTLFRPVVTAGQTLTVSTGNAAIDLAALADAVLDEAVEGSYTQRQLLRLFAAVLLGKANNIKASPGTGNYRDLADTKNRVQVSHDNGDRSSVTLDAS